MTKARRTFWIVLFFQISMPAVALVSAPAHFGFQMYAGSGWTKVHIKDANGDTREFDPSGLVARYRQDTNWTARLPEHICTHVQSVVRVHVVRWRAERIYTCR